MSSLDSNSESERLTQSERDMEKKITIGVCVMEKKVKCGSEVLLFLFARFFTIRLRSQNCKWIQQCMYTMNLFISLCRCFQRRWDRFSKGFKDSANSRY